MRPLVQLLRIALQTFITLSLIGLLLTYLNPKSTSFQVPARIRSELGQSVQHDAQKSPQSPPLGASGYSHTHFHSHNDYTNEQTQDPLETPAFETTHYTSPDSSIQHFTLTRSDLSTSQPPNQSVLFLTITRDEGSWGRNPTESPRTIYSFLDFITNTTLPGSAASVGILTSSQSEYDLYKHILTPTNNPTTQPFDYPFHRITLIYHDAPTRAPLPLTTSSKSPSQSPSPSAPPPQNPDRNSRHAIAQHERRATLAKLRNYLQLTSLHTESHILWLDSDVYKFSSNTMVTTMLTLTTTTPTHEVGILTARCRAGEPEKADAWLAKHPGFRIPGPPSDGEQEADERGREGGKYEVIAWGMRSQGQYDLNAWRGRRTGPNNAEQEALWGDLSAWEPHPFPDGKTDILDKVLEVDGTGERDVSRLDSVGGTVLMIRSDLVRMGLNFAAGYYVGMTFEHGEGYDGIESEGLCLLSRSFSRDGKSMCYTMGGSWSVWHTVF